LRLAASQLVGEPIVLNTNRRFVERALRLGFRSVGLFEPELPSLCVDDRRRYIWMLLDKGSIIPRHDDPMRLPAGRASRPRFPSGDLGAALPIWNSPGGMRRNFIPTPFVNSTGTPRYRARAS